jgi:hypothetical protein
MDGEKEGKEEMELIKRPRRPLEKVPQQTSAISEIILKFREWSREEGRKRRRKREERDRGQEERKDNKVEPGFCCRAGV